MSIEIAANVNGPVTLENIFSDSTTPKTLLLFAKVDAWPAGTTGHADIGLMRIKNDDASNFGEVYTAVSGANAGPWGQIYSGASTYFGTGRAKTESAGVWVPIAITFASATSRTLRWYQSGAMWAATNATNRPITGLDDLILFNGAYTVSARRFAHLTVLNQSITDAQFDEYRLTGAIAGASVLERWAATSNWGGGDIPSTGSGGHAITPPGAWTYSSDNPPITLPVSINNISSPVVYGARSNWVTAGFSPAVNFAEIAGVGCSNVDSTGFALPGFIDGATLPAPGVRSLIAGNGDQSVIADVVVGVGDGFKAQILTDPNTNSAGSCLKNFNPPAKAGDFIVHPTTNTTDVDGFGIVSTDTVEPMFFVHISVDEVDPNICVAYPFWVQVYDGVAEIKSYRASAVFLSANKFYAKKVMANFN